MKIIIVHPYLYQPRGAEKQALNLTNNLIKKNEEISFLTFFSKKNPSLLCLTKDIKIITRPKLPFFKYVHMFYPIIILMTSYKKIFKEADVINIHNFPASLTIKKIKKPIVWMCNEVPWVYPPSRRFKRFFRLIQRKYQRIDYKLIRSNVQKIVVLDKKRKRDVLKYYGINAEIVRSGVDITKYFPLSKKLSRKKIENYSNKKLKKKVVLFVSDLSPIKRVKDFLEAINLLKEKKNITSIIVGSGEDEKLIKQYKSLIDIIHFKNVPEEIMPYIYNSADIFIFPAINQPWGLVPFEAMACKIPTIVSKDTGASEVLENLKNSILVDPKKPEVISQKIKLLLTNKKLYQQISNEGYKLVRKELNAEKYCEKMLRIFNEAKKEFEKQLKKEYNLKKR
jgi:glycosyltransferase involved in cell wall biosynthesis